MTLKTDLQSAHGTTRRFFLKVAGLKDVLWQPVQVPDRNGLFAGEGPPGPHSVQDTSLLALWRLNEYAAAADAADELGAHDGIATSAPPVDTGGHFDNNARSFTTSDYFKTGANTHFSRQRLTWGGWVNYDTATPNALSSILWKQRTADTGNTGFSWRMSTHNAATSKPSASLRFTDAAEITVDFAGTAFTADTWHYVIATWDGTTLTLYIDGGIGTGNIITDATGSGKTIQYDDAFEVFIGGNDTATDKSFDGSLQDMAVWGECKSAEWVRRQYLDGLGYGRPGLNCLRLPSVEHHTELSLDDMRSSLSAMTFELDDIEDPTDRTKSHFGKLFAPGRWNSSSTNHTVMRRKDDEDTELEADATTIFVKKTSRFDSFAASGEAHIGSETFSYAAKGTDTQTGFTTAETIGTFTTVVKGLYSPYVGPRGGAETTFGHVYEYPHVDDDLEGFSTGAQVVSTVPYTWIGRDVGLYVTALDEQATTGIDWHAESDALLVWAGNIDSIGYDPQAAGWKVYCESKLKMLDEVKIGGGGPTAAVAEINLNGSNGREFQILEMDGTGLVGIVASASITVTQGYYTASDLVRELNNKLANVGWTNVNGTHTSGIFKFKWDVGSGFYAAGEGKTQFEFSFTPASYFYRFIPFGIRPVNTPGAYEVNKNNPCHALQAMGWDLARDFGVDLVTDGSGNGILSTERAPYHVYHPLGTPFNGSKLAVEEKRGHLLWTDQGELSAANAYVVSKDARESPSDDRRTVAIGYTAKGSIAITNGPTGTELTLSAVNRQRAPNPAPGNTAFIGTNKKDEALAVENMILPEHRDDNNVSIEPFAMLVKLLASTGTKNYNEPATVGWDAYPAGQGVGFPFGLIDVTSFQEADKWIKSAYPTLAVRRFNPMNKSRPWNEYFKREAALFGFALAWRLGKIALQPVFRLELQDAQVTLDDSSTAAPDDAPEVETSTDHVVNQRTLFTDYDWSKDEYNREVVIKDRESIEGVRGLVKGREVKHPGLQQFTLNAGLVSDLTNIWENEARMVRFPWQKVRWTLNPTFFNRVFVGDVVNFAPATKYPDPFGSGSMSATTKALVLDVSWNLEDMKGTCTLLVHSRYDEGVTLPWAPAALIDITDNTGNFSSGWDATALLLSLTDLTFGATGDTDDGAALAPVGGELVKIHARAPADPTSLTAGEGGASGFTATVDTGGYEVASAGVLPLTADPFGGNFDTEIEYVITFQDYPAATAAMKLIASYQADSNTELLNSADEAQRWG